jgi:hypothetical protein
MEFDNGVLNFENAEGRKWRLTNSEKPTLSFAYDALSVTHAHALRRLGGRVQPLTKREVDEVAAFVANQSPPSRHEQLVVDLKALAYGLINAAIAEFNFGNLIDVQVAARERSTDLRAQGARQALAYVDSVWNSYHALVANIRSTNDDELQGLNDYANMMPMLPRLNTQASATEDDAEISKAEIGKKVVTPCGVNGSTQVAGGELAGRPVALMTCAPQEADFSTIVDRAFVFDDFFPETQLRLYEKWAMQSPHWMLSNSSHDEHGHAKHRIWGASFIEAWRRKGWAGLPPVLFSIVATVFQKLDLTITEPEYIGLNGQSKDQTASMHTDCEHDSPDDMSILVYLGEDTDGDLILYDKADTARSLHRIAFAPNRVVVFDGSVPHQALAPTDDKFRMSVIIRGKYKVGATDLIAARGGA